MSVSHVRLSWWSRLWHRNECLTPPAEREARDTVVRALTGDTDALEHALDRERALLEKRDRRAHDRVD